MEGLMNPLYCHTVTKLNLFDAWITPFLRVSDHVFKEKRIRQFITPFTWNKKPITLQLMGTDPTMLAETAVAVTEYSKKSLDNRVVGINFNFACPSRKVIKNGAGGNCLRNPDLMSQIVSETKPQLKGRAYVEAKIRVGFDSPDEMERIIPTLLDAGTELLHVHFRTIAEGYRAVEGRQERLLKARQLCQPIPMFASGDIYTPEDAKQVLSVADGLLAARGLLKDPFLIQKIKGELKSDMDGRIQFIRALLDSAMEMPYVPKKGTILEQVAWLYGPKTEMFQKFLKLNYGELLDHNLDYVESFKLSL